MIPNTQIQFKIPIQSLKSSTPLSIRSARSAKFSSFSHLKTPVSTSNRTNPSPLTSSQPSKAQAKKVPPESSDFPDWLISRTDFQSYLSDNSEKVSVIKFCSKPSQKRETWEKREIIDYVKNCIFFKDFTDFTCSELCEKLTSVEYPAGQIIIKQGDQGDKMLIIVSGTVNVYRNGALADRISEKNVVGEKALENNSPRGATVISDTPIQALVLKKQDYQEIVMRHKHKMISQIVNFLKKIEFFQMLIGARLELLAFNMFLARYKDKHTIFEELSQADTIYFVKEGKIRLSMKVTLTNKRKIPNNKNEVRVEKKTYEKTLKICEKFDFFGEEELAIHGERKCKAECIGDCELLLLRKEHFFEILTDKERKDLLGIHKSLPDKGEAIDSVRKSISNKTIKSRAIIDACRVGGKGTKTGSVVGRKDSLLLIETNAYFV